MYGGRSKRGRKGERTRQGGCSVLSHAGLPLPGELHRRHLIVPNPALVESGRLLQNGVDEGRAAGDVGGSNHVVNHG